MHCALAIPRPLRCGHAAAALQGPCRRHTHSNGGARRAFGPLLQDRPVFRIGAAVRVLREPREFYRELLQGVARAQRRISLSSLYLGSEERELVAALDAALGRRSDLEVHVLLDCLRGTRSDGRGASSATLLAPLVARHGRDRVRVSLYHTPALSGLGKRAWPARLNETLGLQHIKAYVFDDTTIVSGANLSRDYFTARQDRYMCVPDRPLADYFCGLADTIGQVSFELGPPAPGSPCGDGYALAMPPGAPDPSREPRAFEQAANGAVGRFLRRMAAAHPGPKLDLDPEPGETLAIPTVQMRQLGITQDERHMGEFFGAVDAWAQTHACRTVLASAYFNLSAQYARSVLGSGGRWDVLVASPEANGFHSARGISRFVPDMYSIIEHDFVRAARRHRRPGISVAEYARAGWTFHAKGLWCYLDRRLPQLTMIGSPNYGHRSIYRDLEAQVTLVTACPRLQQDLHDEAAALLAHARPVAEHELRARARAAPLWLHGLRPLIQNKM
ncbi:CDP-diacylglycerol--glycerol-3-phosphate 3-phosphatidyltransferase [Coemansia javaensis]|uniref:CDP-diacylglycerol--glycerol-3-phosphate 3-phosphatidyltransferase n=1 Tax=Coemansia javaensis TaxID=2761396 RepID=A0A9W8LKM6_9FUNG|nr:CDP-diacylglycerol--glycerol-3-phosphate 3-phosphatidyltransferase [Coemansia javaensis]